MSPSVNSNKTTQWVGNLKLEKLKRCICVLFSGLSGPFNYTVNYYFRLLKDIYKPQMYN